MRRHSPLLLALLLFACSSSKEAKRSSEDEMAATELRRYEETFRPSDFEPRPALARAHPAQDSAGATIGSDVALPPSMELVQGFRVQVFATSDIDDANAQKSQLEAIFPSEWFYLQYDQPTYKIRAGNFLSRFAAERFARQLIDNGYKDAWVVPERVYKQPPPPQRTLPVPGQPR